ncbi:MAG: cobalt ABC transporter permease [Caldimicrobium sp.]
MRKIVVIILGLGLLLFSVVKAEETKEKWTGLDEAVIEKVAEEKGRAPKSIFNLEGDTELFVFSLFSGLAGFIGGYYWRKLLSEEKNASSQGLTTSLYHKD